jgi:fucose 4-O-acetylase-like acetyltransferase
MTNAGQLGPRSLAQHDERVSAGGKPPSSRYGYADNLKVLLVIGVIVGHATMAWIENDAWVLEEPPVREPLLTLLNLAALVGVLFAMPLFFLIAGMFTPQSLQRKGRSRYIADRTIRLGVPLVFYMLFLGPVVEYVDVQDNAGWNRGFPAFVWHCWANPAPGPLWFLWVLLLFSVAYAIVRTVAPRRTTGTAPLQVRYLVTTGALIAIAYFLLRIPLTFGQEVGQDLFLDQAPGWLAAFTLGVLGGERGWFDRLSPDMSRGLFRVGWVGVLTAIVLASATAGAMGLDIDVVLAGGTWESAVIAVTQAVLVVALAPWLVDVFRRRFDHRGRVLREMGRAAFAAYVLHQVVLVGTVLATRSVAWPPELEWVAAAGLAVVGSFVVGALLIRVKRRDFPAVLIRAAPSW